MLSYIELNANRIKNIIVAEESYIQSLPNPESFILYDSIPDENRNTIKMGYEYNSEDKKFFPPKPPYFHSWILNENTNNWEPPVPSPNDGKPYVWDESIVNWKEYVEEEPPTE